MAVIEGKLDIVVDRAKLLAAIDRSGGPTHEFTVETLADQICKAFCGPRKLAPTSGLASEIHRRQHVEIARAIIEA
jgi:hypothetical protein